MELRHLRYFVVVAEEENISRAAAKLKIAQPPLSRQIRDLEEHLGVALFDRTGKAVRLNQAGRIFWQEARAVLNRVEQARQTVRALAQPRREELHVGYAPSVTVELLPSILRDFEAEFPHTQVQLHDASTAEMVAGLKTGRLHLALTVLPRKQEDLRCLHYDHLKDVQMMAAMATDHPLAHGRTCELKQVLDHELVVYSRVGYPEYHAWLESVASEVGLCPKIIEEQEGAISLIAAVEARRGIALITDTFHHLAGNRLVIKRLSPAPSPVKLGVLTMDAPQSAEILRFRQIAQHYA
jgi:LysR family transcriptional regulator, benzoate and cis,cis-muconate-responsive activator of ben and cat genes